MRLKRNATQRRVIIEPDQRVSSMKLPLTTVDNLASGRYLPRAGSIKMGIEGAELRALAGAAAVTRRFRPRRAICLYHLEDDPAEIPAFIGSLRQEYIQA